MIELLYILATWRLTSLFANEDGPFKMFERFRNFIKVDCFWCMSVWFGVLIGLLTNGLLVGLAYSAGAILIEEIVCVLDAKSGSIRK